MSASKPRVGLFVACLFDLPRPSSGFAAIKLLERAGLRELGVKRRPRAPLQSAGSTVREMAELEICCGFGGASCVKYPEVRCAW